MPLSPGDKLGAYEIVSSIGKGGMGEVWRARDPQLGRDVAIKVSAQQFTDRFEREARAIAALNHPNVCTLYHIGPDYLVMEHIEGPTLAERIREGPIPLEEALAIARQIAGALEAAHDKGIVHRDLKPANVKLAPDGTVKVLDFGLAKYSRERETVDLDHSPTTLDAATRAGTLLGTAAYMSPEQARGKEVDKRADIWAFGVVLHEMVTGKRLFQGEDITETLASVMKENPDLSAVPQRLQRLLRKCLEKDPRKRLRDISGVELLLEEPAEDPGAGVGTAVLSGLLLIAFAAAAFLYFRGANPPSAPPSANLIMEIGPAEMLGPVRGYNRPSQTAFAISPDGATVVFAGSRDRKSMLYRRPLADATAYPIPGTEGAEAPFFSPDGQWVGFATENKLKKVALKGGPPIDLCDIGSGRTFRGASWGSGGAIAFVDGGALWTVPDSGGKPARLSEPGEGAPGSPTFLPDGKTVLVALAGGRGNNSEEAHIDSIQVATKQRKTVLTNAADALYSPTGHLVFLRQASLLAVPFDAERVEVSGAPVPLIAGIMQSINAPNGADETGMGQFALSGSGTLIYAYGGIFPTPSSSLVQVDRNGNETKLAETQGTLVAVRISPDEHRVVAFKTNEGSRATDLWSWELPSGVSTRLTSSGHARWPLFSADGRSVVYLDGSGKDSGIYRLPLDGGAVTRLTQSDQAGPPLSLSADGKWLAWWADFRRVLVRDLGGAGESRRQVGAANFNTSDAEFSPDGRWIAYVSDESGADEVYVQAFPGPGEKHRISSNGGINPAWSRDGKQLYFMEWNSLAGGGKTPMMAVPISNGSPTGAPRQLFDAFGVTTPSRSYAVTSDGRFIMARFHSPGDERVMQVHVLLGWSEELKRRVPSK